MFFSFSQHGGSIYVGQWSRLVWTRCHCHWPATKVGSEWEEMIIFFRLRKCFINTFLLFLAPFNFLCSQGPSLCLLFAVPLSVRFALEISPLKKENRDGFKNNNSNNNSNNNNNSRTTTTPATTKQQRRHFKTGHQPLSDFLFSLVHSAHVKFFA